MPTCLTKCQLRYTKAYPYYVFWIVQATYFSIMAFFNASLSLSRLHCPCSLIRRSPCVDVSVIFWDFMRRYRPNTHCWAASSHLHLKRVQWVKNFSRTLWLIVQWSHSSELIQTLIFTLSLLLALTCIILLGAVWSDLLTERVV